MKINTNLKEKTELVNALTELYKVCGRKEVIDEVVIETILESSIIISDN